MTRDEYDAFIDALLAGDKTSFKEWEASTPYFDGCLPIEVMAERGRDTLRFGPMKPVGLDDPHTGGARPYAVVQLRQDNALGTLWNMVGFQTKLKHAEQVRIFRMIPGLGEAEFARLGGLHRNTFLNSPKLLDRVAAPEGDAAPALCRADHRRRRLRRERRHRPAGGALRGRRAARPCRSSRRRRRRRSARSSGTSPAAISPPTTRRATARARSFQPMNINYGLLPDIEAPPQDAEESVSRARTGAAQKSAPCRCAPSPTSIAGLPRMRRKRQPNSVRRW